MRVFYEGRDSVKAKFSKHKRKDPGIATIGNDVWIGINSIIKAGVTIGNGAVIGMGSVVTKDVEDYTIVGGCPARVIRKRFDDDIIRKLSEIQWWNFSDDMLRKYAQYFTNPEKFIEEWKNK